jgi:hypothetical protein
MSEPRESLTAAPPKKLAERCSFWLRGRQCDHYKLSGSSYCAMHNKVKA